MLNSKIKSEQTNIYHENELLIAQNKIIKVDFDRKQKRGVDRQTDDAKG